MFKKTIISEFFTTINLSIFLRTIAFLTYKLPFIRYGNSTENIEDELLLYIGNSKSKIISYYNGRSAIYNLLKTIGVKKYEEVIVSGYTCITVSNAVLQSGAKIVYSDINKDNLGFDLIDLKSKITSKTKVIIVQHTFGKPSNVKEIINIAKKKNILVIEDCAHSIGSRIDDKKLGSFGDFSVFSTGRDKVISGVTGGFLIINNKKYFQKIIDINKQLNIPSITLVIRNLMYNIFAYFSYKTYDFFKLGRIIIFLSRKFNIITEILTKKEKNCNYNKFSCKLPNSLASLASKELENIKIISIHRRLLAHYYIDNIKNKYISFIYKEQKNEKNNYFRFPILSKTESLSIELYKYMRKNNVILGNSWSGGNIVPIGSNIKKAGYINGSCLIAENISKRILTLPNHFGITPEDSEKVVQLLNNFKK